KAAHPTWDYHQLIDQLKNTVYKDPNNADFNLVGWKGRLDLGALLGAPPPADTTPPAVISAVASGPAAGQVNTLTFTFSEGVSFDASNIYSFPGPNGAVADPGYVVSGSGTTWSVTFATQTTPGAYQMEIRGVTDLSPNKNALTSYTATFSVGSQFV